MGWRLGGASTKTLEGDALVESSGMRGSVTWKEFLGKEQDAHKHGGVRELEKQREGAQEPQICKSTVLGGASTKRPEKMF